MINNKLEKSLSISQAVGLGITIVVGSGLLLLPGLAYQDAGASSIYVWVICALLVIPLLVIFSALGAKYPTAGGVAGFMQNVFSRHISSATEVMLLGTFGLGIPAIALTGSYYVNTLIFVDVQFEIITLTISLLMIFAAFTVNYLGAAISGNIQKYLAITLVLALLLIPILSLVFVSEYKGEGINRISNIEISNIFPLLGMVFFAYTGWEMLSFTIEEYKNPKRDYPISVALSFFIVIILYFLLVISIQLIVPIDDVLLGTAPLSALAQQVFGSMAGNLVGVLSFIIILANLIGAIWAASRLVFSSAREGLLPASIAKLSVNKVPRASLVVTCLFFSTVLILNYFNILKVNDLLRLTGQNFFILYGMAVLAYIKISETKKQKIFGIISLMIVVITMGTFGVELLYPIVLLSFGYFMSKYKSWK
ncbi:amino acid permease-associated region [Bathymodiolus heckerae thiotrophic gill symbiont]|uniref:APC family permease n=1 Tax=Bathymodiolus heckerae thiotrophic gill symbiont TaxID=1052212 RepID=UPI0010AF2A3D|nr:amino acid permease [Bathymodiolus heckerae thiotrophic gill symbiont]SHN89158.1 amino acid permease-associated region [Bathymodiolus heckerae thiotrophic gill symbiont]